MMSKRDDSLDTQIKDLARVIAGQAHAIAEGSVIGSRLVAVKRVHGNVATLLAWAEREAVER
jgi:hypothetical protein